MEGLGSTVAKALEIGEITNHFCYVVSQAFGQTHIGYPYSQQKITSCMLKTVCVLHEFDQEKIRNQMQKQLKHQPRHIRKIGRGAPAGQHAKDLVNPKLQELVAGLAVPAAPASTGGDQPDLK
jgi:hypothetical protein